jgi:hypothetical protein
MGLQKGAPDYAASGMPSFSRNQLVGTLITPPILNDGMSPLLIALYVALRPVHRIRRASPGEQKSWNRIAAMAEFMILPLR